MSSIPPYSRSLKCIGCGAHRERQCGPLREIDATRRGSLRDGRSKEDDDAYTQILQETEARRAAWTRAGGAEGREVLGIHTWEGRDDLLEEGGDAGAISRREVME
jgi:hypothetical protein